LIERRVVAALAHLLEDAEAVGAGARTQVHVGERAVEEGVADVG